MPRVKGLKGKGTFAKKGKKGSYHSFGKPISLKAFRKVKKGF